MTRKWYVIRTKPRSEKIVANGLQRDGFISYCPNVRTPRPNEESILMPLFPGYIFLQIEMGTEGADLTRDRLGILGWLRFGDTIPWVPDEVVANIRQRVRMINKDGGVWRHFQPGDKVRVVSGKLESLAEVIEETVTTQGGQVRVLLDFMGRTVPAQVPWHDVRPIDAESFVADRPHTLPRRTRGRGRWIRGQKLLAVNAQGS